MNQAAPPQDKKITTKFAKSTKLEKLNNPTCASCSSWLENSFANNAR
jgi:hypothetical protein